VTILSRPVAAVIAAAAVSVGLVAPAARAASAAPKTETASAGDVTATYTYRDAGGGKWADMRLTVTRGGVTAFDAVPEVSGRFGCEAPYCAPAGLGTRPSLRVLDVDGDGEPEVIVDLFTGGAHCCVVAEILRWTGAAYATAARNFADFGYTLDPPAAPGAPATFVTGDARFAYAFASFADSAFPVRLLTYVGGSWHDVTRDHPESLRADAARWAKSYHRRRSGSRSLGVLAAWAADEYRLGHQAQVHRFLRNELRAGRLRGDRYWPRGKAYISVLERRLRAWGYT
jgi:hypothetical protein